MILSSVDNNFMFWGENDIAVQHEFKNARGGTAISLRSPVRERE